MECPDAGERSSPRTRKQYGHRYDVNKLEMRISLYVGWCTCRLIKQGTLSGRNPEDSD